MKKYSLILMVLIIALAGCTGNAEWLKHDTLYADFDHAVFSICGHKRATVQDAAKSQARGWWGDEIIVNGGCK